jgi:hypothetical protein
MKVISKYIKTQSSTLDINNSYNRDIFIFSAYQVKINFSSIKSCI